MIKVREYCGLRTMLLDNKMKYYEQSRIVFLIRETKTK